MMIIEIRFRCMHDTAEQDVVMLRLTRQLCKTLLTQAALIADQHEPDVEITIGDFHLADEKLLLFDDDGNEYDSEVIPVVERFNNPQGLNRVRINTPKQPEPPTLESDDERD